MGDHLKFLNFEIVFQKSILILLILFLNACAEENINSNPAKDLIKQNTFIIVPINIYAAKVSKSKAEAYIKKYCHFKHLPPAEILNCDALKVCEEGYCVQEYESHGTAFLMNSGTTLFTAWHVLFPSQAAGLYFIKSYALRIEEEERLKLFSSLAPSFVLLDHNKNIVYDTREHHTTYDSMGDPLSTIYAITGLNEFNEPFGYFENIPYDYVGLKLSKSLGVGLKLAQTKPKTSDQFSTAGFGYDGRNFSFSFSVGQRQSLYDLKLSTGSYSDYELNPLGLAIEDFYSKSILDQLIYLGYSRESAEAQIKEYGLELITNSIQTVINTSLPRHLKDADIEKNSNVIFTDNTIMPGQSGSPLTNSKGEVVGIITNGILARPKLQDYISMGAGAYLFTPLEN